MTPLEIAQALRHDLKYAGFTIQNLEQGSPVETWAAKAIYKDLFATRRGKSCLELMREAEEKLNGALRVELVALQQAAQALDEWRDKLQAGILLGGLQTQVKVMLALADALVITARQHG
jgi:hypothetical protein